MLVAVLCGLLGAVSLAALAGARRTESAYGRYLHSINASDVEVNVPSPDLSLDARVAALPGVRSSAAWLGLDANPVVHGKVDSSFQTDGFAGSVDGEYFTHDTMTVLAGHLPPLGSTNEVALTPSVARLFGVGVGDRVTYQFENSLSPTNTPTGEVSYRVAAIIELPPLLVDQFDQVAQSVLPPAATAAALRLPGAVAFSWVGVHVVGGSAGVPAFQETVARFGARVGNGYTFAVRRLDTVHQQVQEAIKPQAVAVALLGALAALGAPGARRVRPWPNSSTTPLGRPAPCVPLVLRGGRTPWHAVRAARSPSSPACCSPSSVPCCFHPSRPLGRSDRSTRHVASSSMPPCCWAAAWSSPCCSWACSPGCPGAPSGSRDESVSAQRRSWPGQPAARAPRDGAARRGLRLCGAARNRADRRPRQPDRVGRRRRRRRDRGRVRGQPQRARDPPGTVRVELECPSPERRRLRKLPPSRRQRHHVGKR